MSRVLLVVIFFLSCAAGKVNQKKDMPYDFVYKQEKKGSVVEDKSITSNSNVASNASSGDKISDFKGRDKGISEPMVDKRFFREEKSGSDVNSGSGSGKEREGLKELDDIEFDNYKAKDLEGYEEVGYASFYGKRFHGMKTASGEIFDMYKMTAAHRTLPFGTIVEVENLENHKKVRVKINDRGPYAKNRIIDLSYMAAKKLGFINKGTALVKIRVIGMGKIEPLETNSYGEKAFIKSVKKEKYEGGDEPIREDTKAIVDKPHKDIKKRRSLGYQGKFIVQLGIFSLERNAYGLKKQVEQDFANLQVKVKKDGLLYRVYVDGFNEKEDAEEIADILRSGGYEAFVKEIM
jgi:rare lipoprotein A